MTDGELPAEEPKKSKGGGRLTQGPVGKKMLAITLPMIWGLIAVIGFNIADTYFVGQLGLQELAAISFAFPIVLTIISLGVGLSMGSSSVISRSVGAEGHDKARQHTTSALTLAFVVGILVGLLGLATMDPLFTAMGAPKEMLPLIKDYMTIWYLSVPLVIVPMTANGCMRGVGLATIPSMIMNLAALINVILDPLLIFGLWGFPRLEMEGAALATSISRALTLVAAVWILHRRERLIDWSVGSLKEIWAGWKAVLHIALPTSATQIMTPLASAIITALVATYGASAVAGFGVAQRLEAFSLIPLFALSASISPFIGQNWGARFYDRVREAMRLSFIGSLICGACAALVLIFFGDLLVAVFNTDKDVIAAGTLYLLTVPFSYGLLGIQLCASSAFNGQGKPTPALLLGAGRMFALYLPLAFLLSHFFGLQGVFVSAAIANSAVGILGYVMVRRACRTPEAASVTA